MYTFMNTDMNKYLILRLCIGMLINYCKKKGCGCGEGCVININI